MGSNIRVTILAGRNQGECEAACGEDWSLPASINLASERIREKFGEGISVEYIDLPGDLENESMRKGTDMIKDRNLSLPLLLINGEVRISGQFDIRQLLDVIEIQMEVGI